MSDLRAAAQQALRQALEALGKWSSGRDIDAVELNDLITTLDAALEQPSPVFQDHSIPLGRRTQEQPIQPTAWLTDRQTMYFNKEDARRDCDGFILPLYAHPPRREWRGLKEWEINDGRDQLPTEDLCNWSFRQGVYFAEKALKERNA